MDIKIPDKLVRETAKGNVVIFVGAGLSVGAGLPGWWTLLNTMLNHLKTLEDHDALKIKIIEKNLNNDKLLEVARDLRKELGRKRFFEQLQSIIKPKTGPLETHRLIQQLPLHAVLTTNYDTLLEETYKKDAFTQIDTRKLSDAFRKDEVYILKCHGDITRPDTIVLTKEDYDTVIHESMAFQKLIEYLFMAKTVLYLGYSLSDPDFDLFRGRLKSIFGDYVPEQYALMAYDLYGEKADPDAQLIMEHEIASKRDDENLHIIPFAIDKNFTGVETFLRMLVEQSGAMDMASMQAEWDKSKSPFPGLRAFTDADSMAFFGRDREIVTLRHKLNIRQFVMVVGASGSGKSSLVWAGLVPRIRDEVNKFHFIRITPGTDPFENLYANETLKALVEDVSIETLKLRRTAILPILHSIIASESDTRILLFVDQFEELFTLTKDETDRLEFVEMLRATTPLVQVVATMRADFYHQATKYLEYELSQSNMTLSQPSEAQLYDMIEKPAQLIDLTFEHGLVDEIVKDTGNEPGNLPLLAYLLDQIYTVEKDDDMHVAREEYYALGGVQGAIGKMASRIYEELPGDDSAKSEWLKRVFRDLIAMDKDGKATRRRGNLQQIAPEDREWVEVFVNQRLLVKSQDKNTRQQYVEVAHEAILREWDMLAEWIESRRGDFRVIQRMRGNFEWWLSHGKLVQDLPADEQIREFKDALNNLGQSIGTESDDFRVFITDETDRRLQTLREETIDAKRFDYLSYRLKEIGVYDYEILTAVVVNPNALNEVRSNAVYTLEQIGDPDAVRFLRPVVLVEDYQLRDKAFELIREWDTGELLLAAGDALRHHNGDVRGTAMAMLHSAEIFEEMIPVLLDILSHDDAGVRLSAARQLAYHAHHPDSVPVLLDALTDETLRDNAISFLGYAGDSRAVPHLIPLLDSEELAVSYYAMTALAQIGDTDALPALRRFLNHEDEDRASNAILAVVACGDKSLMPELIEILNGERNDRKLGLDIDTVRTLIKLDDSVIDDYLVDGFRIVHHQAQREIISYLVDKDSPLAVEALSAGLASDEADTRRHALRLLQTKHINEELASQLTGMFFDNDSAISDRAFTLLKAIDSPLIIPKLKSIYAQDGYSPEHGRAVSLLGSLATDDAIQELIALIDNIYLNDEAIKTLIQIGNEAVVDALIKIDTADELNKRVDDAIRILATIGGERVLDALIDMLNRAFENDDYDTTMWNVRVEIYQALQKLNDERAIPELVNALSKLDMEQPGNEEVAVIQALAHYRYEGLTDSILPLLDKDNLHGYVYEAVVEALGRINAEKAIPTLIRLIEAPDDPNLSNHAAGALSKISQEHLEAVLAPMAEDEDRDKRQLFAQYTQSPESIPVLVKMLSDADEYIRQTAIETLGRIGNPGTIPALKTALESTHDESEINKLQDTLITLGDHSLIDTFIPQLQHDEWFERMTAIEKLGNIGDPALIPVLSPHLRDTMEDVRGITVISLYKCKPDLDIIRTHRNVSTIRFLMNLLAEDEEYRYATIDKNLLVDILRVIEHPMTQEAVARWDR